MQKRIISGTIFALAIALFFVCREFVDYRCFYLLLCIFSTVGTNEIARALRGYFAPISITVCTIFGALYVPAFAISEYFFTGYGLIGATALIALAFIITTIANVKNGMKSCLGVLIPLLYPSILILFQMLANELALGFIILLLTYVISPLTDTCAYFIGITYNKIRGGKAKKLCVKLSPKKTVAGAIGGLIGGILGAFLVWLVFKPELSISYPVLFFIIVGAIASIFNQVGDLFESYIKRKVGIKDIGNLIPGHGGVMDRIDGITFTGVFLFLAFLLV